MATCPRRRVSRPVVMLAKAGIQRTPRTGSPAFAGDDSEGRQPTLVPGHTLTLSSAQHDGRRTHRIPPQALAAGASAVAGRKPLAHRGAQRLPVPGGRRDLGDRGAGGRVSAQAVSAARRHRGDLRPPDRRRHPAASRARYAAASDRRLCARRHRRRRHRHCDGPLAPLRGYLPAAGEHRRADPGHRLRAALPAVVRARQRHDDPAGGLRLGLPDHLQHLDRREIREGNLGAFGAGDGRRRPAPVPARHPARRPALHPDRVAAWSGAGLAHPGRRRDARRGVVGARLDDLRRARVPQHRRDARRRRRHRHDRAGAGETRVPAHRAL